MMTNVVLYTKYERKFTNGRGGLGLSVVQEIGSDTERMLVCWDRSVGNPNSKENVG